MKSRFIAVLGAGLVLLSSTAVTAEELKGLNNIVGGTPVSADVYPWIVTFRYSDTSPSCGISYGHFCTGSLIAGNRDGKSYLLSAAHCFVDYEDTIQRLSEYHSGNGRTCVFRLTADIGRDDQDDAAETDFDRIYIDEVRLHPEYSDTSTVADVAVAWSAMTTQIQPIKLRETPNCCENGDVVSVIGYGTDYEGGPLTDTLEHVEVFYEDAEKCAESYGAAIRPGMICGAVPGGGKDACQGDSGGPYVVGNDADALQIGIVSWGAGCARDNAPGVYAEVGYYYSWIYEFYQGGNTVTSTSTTTEEPEAGTERADCNFAKVHGYLWAIDKCNGRGNSSFMIKCEDGLPMFYEYDIKDCKGNLILNNIDYSRYTENFRCGGTDGNCESEPFNFDVYADGLCAEKMYSDTVHFVTDCVRNAYGGSERVECSEDGEYEIFEYSDRRCSSDSTKKVISDDECVGIEDGSKLNNVKMSCEPEDLTSEEEENPMKLFDCDYVWYDGYPWALEQCNHHGNNESGILKCEGGKIVTITYPNGDCTGQSDSEPYDMTDDLDSGAGLYKCGRPDGVCKGIPFTVADFNEENCRDEIDNNFIYWLVYGCVESPDGSVYTDCIEDTYVKLTYGDSKCVDTETYDIYDKDDCVDGMKFQCRTADVPASAPDMSIIRRLIMLVGLSLCFLVMV